MFLATVGALSLILFAYRLLRQIQTGVRCFVLRRRTDFAACGQWAVVTGATGGIGAAFVDELASRGLDVYLLGRSEAALAALAADMARRHAGRQFRTLCVDLSADDCRYGELSAALGGLDVGVLVNNAGRADDVPGYLDELDVKLGAEMLRTNARAVVLLSHCVLGGMRRRRRGAVINVASFAALNVCPMMSLYAATKAFTAYLTRSLESEYGEHGVRFLCLFPSFVQTRMAGGLIDASAPSVLMPTPERYVRSALNTFGVGVHSTGYWFHAFFATILQLLPCAMARKLGDDNMREMIAFAKKKHGVSVGNGVGNGNGNGHSTVTTVGAATANGHHATSHGNGHRATSHGNGHHATSNGNGVKRE